MSTSARLGRTGRIISAVALAGLCLAACTQTPHHPRPSRSQALKVNAADSMVWCLLHRRIIPLHDVRGRSWFKNGKMRDNAALVVWKLNHSMKTYGGKILGDWIEQAQQQWPTSLCGPEPTAFPSASVYPLASPSP